MTRSALLDDVRPLLLEGLKNKSVHSAAPIVFLCVSIRDGLQPTSDGLQPSSDGLQPSSDGLHPSSDGLVAINHLLN